MVCFKDSKSTASSYWRRDEDMAISPDVGLEAGAASASAATTDDIATGVRMKRQWLSREDGGADRADAIYVCTGIEYRYGIAMDSVRLTTAQSLRKKGVIDCTRGVSREQRAINRRKKLESLISSGNDGRNRSSGVPKHPIGVRKRLKGLNCARNNMLKAIMEEEALAAFRKKEQAEREKRYGGIPDRAATGSSFLEKPFGHPVLSANDTSDLSRFVVSLALFDGDCAAVVLYKMLFACSGIPLPDLNPNKVEVHLPQYGTVDGLLGLYDDDIAIITSLGLLDVHPMDLCHPMDLDLPARYVCDDDDGILVFGRAFKSGSLLATEGSLRREHPCTWVSDTEGLTEVCL
ncbi:hypothetical protein EJB05_19897, partial [Eragrostis curvula]